jgi:hypothetical protein
VTAMDRAAAARVREFLGHIEDMPDDERVFLLGYLAEAVLRLLDEAEPRPQARERAVHRYLADLAAPPEKGQAALRRYLALPAVFDTEVEMYCLAHRRRSRWLAAPMWWHHVGDQRSCPAMADAPPPCAYA